MFIQKIYNKQKNSLAGFTLIELLVVIAIISLVSSVVFASFGTARAKGRDTKRILDFDQFEIALQLYYEKYGMYPCGDSDAGSGVYVTSDSSWSAGFLNGPHSINGHGPVSTCPPYTPQAGIDEFYSTTALNHAKDPINNLDLGYGYIYKVTFDPSNYSRQSYLLVAQLIPDD